jgi:hypothetical protein
MNAGMIETRHWILGDIHRLSAVRAFPWDRPFWIGTGADRLYRTAGAGQCDHVPVLPYAAHRLHRLQ